MSNNRPVAACLAAALCLSAGCSKEYAHKRLQKGAAEFAAVQAMLDELRAAGKDGIEVVLARQIADGLDETRSKGLRYVLGELATAENVTLKRVDRWRSDLFRATMESTADGATGTVALLLVRGRDDKLYWANTN